MVELRKTYRCNVNHKVVERLLRAWDLRIVHNTRQPRPSGIQQALTEAGQHANLVAQMAEIGLFEVLYTDFTELLFANGDRKAVLMPIVDHRSKMAVGWAVGERANTELALQAWERAKQGLRLLRTSCVGTIMHHDRDAVYTSYRWTWQLLIEDQLRLSYALRGAGDNPEMESFNGRFKTEGQSLFLEAQSISELSRVVEERMVHHNTVRRHSSIGYLPPLTYIEQRRAKDKI